MSLLHASIYSSYILVSTRYDTDVYMIRVHLILSSRSHITSFAGKRYSLSPTGLRPSSSANYCNRRNFLRDAAIGATVFLAAVQQDSCSEQGEARLGDNGQGFSGTDQQGNSKK